MNDWALIRTTFRLSRLLQGLGWPEAGEHEDAEVHFCLPLLGDKLSLAQLEDPLPMSAVTV